jgi:hypothetical protein
VNKVDGVPILDGLAVTLSLAECLADLKRTTGLSASRHGWFGEAPKRERVAQVMKFYGLDRLGGGA